MTAVVNFRMEASEKKYFEEICKNLGMNISTALSIFAKKVCREKRIPFEISIDPFYSEENLKYIDEKIRAVENGTAKIEEHALIED